MGLRRWLQARRRPDPKRPWVRPQFLALFALLTATTGLFAYWAAEQSGLRDESGPPPAAERTEYVGLEASELLDPASCISACSPQERRADWARNHPDAAILEETPMYYRGTLIGYEIRYREPNPT